MLTMTLPSHTQALSSCISTASPTAVPATRQARARGSPRPWQAQWARTQGPAAPRGVVGLPRLLHQNLHGPACMNDHSCTMHVLSVLGLSAHVCRPTAATPPSLTAASALWLLAPPPLLRPDGLFTWPRPKPSASDDATAVAASDAEGLLKLVFSAAVPCWPMRGVGSESPRDCCRPAADCGSDSCRDLLVLCPLALLGVSLCRRCSLVSAASSACRDYQTWHALPLYR